METGKYVISRTGSDGELPARGRKTEYYYRGMGRNNLFRSGNAFNFRKEKRYSYDIIKETKEFVVNLTTKQLCRATDYCGVRSGRDVDKFQEMHLTPQPSEKVKAPGIAESPVNIECRVTQVLELGTHDMFLAEVVAVRVDDDYMDEKGRFDLNAADLVTYSHGEYFTLGKKLGTFGYSVAKNKPQSIAGNNPKHKSKSSTKKV